MTIEELIAALEQASEPSRLLDGEIAALCFPEKYEHSESEHNRRGGHMRVHEYGVFHMGRAPEYTRSLDAAIMLVPEDWTGGDLIWASSRSRDGSDCYARLNKRPEPGPKLLETVMGWGHSRELALCIAALRARMTAAPTKEG